MMDVLKLISRETELFNQDLEKRETDLSQKICSSSFLILGGAGSIGQAVTKEIFKRNPKALHVIDISENNLVELVRDLRSTYGYIEGDFKTFALDIDSLEYDAFFNSAIHYDYVLNLSALKHVRSERDPYTLMRMINVNILNTDKTIRQSIAKGVKKYFCVSTDKATNPVNMMGASKKIMEEFLMKRSKEINISTARFANVAFSDGSLLHSFNQRILKKQPLVAPNDIQRYFVTPKEAGLLCLLSCIYGENRDIFFPKLSEGLHLQTFANIAIKYLENLGFEPYICNSEEEARDYAQNLPQGNKWPCFFTVSDTTGEKDVEEFFTKDEKLDFDTFRDIGIIKNGYEIDEGSLNSFQESVERLKSRRQWTKEELVDLFIQTIPNFDHKEVGKYLDAKM